MAHGPGGIRKATLTRYKRPKLELIKYIYLSKTQLLAQVSRGVQHQLSWHLCGIISREVAR